MFKKLIDTYIFAIAIFLFFLSAIVGLLIRLNFVFPIENISYKNLLQAHSHVAFLGWGYLAVIGSTLTLFIPKDKWLHKIYRISIPTIIICVFLMLFSFSFYGYKTFSIVLLSVFGISSYVLSFKLLKDLNKGNTSSNFIRYGIYYYLLSSLATWFLVFVIIKFGKTNLYYNTIYFYLHFLYNGFFVFLLFGLLFKVFEKQQIQLSEKYKKIFFIYLNVACIPAYALSILWSNGSPTFYAIGFAAAFLQFLSLLFLIKILQQAFSTLKWNVISKVLLNFLVITYSLKVISQVLSAFPYFVQKSLALKPFFIIGYLHLFTLAFMSVFIWLILSKIGKIFLENIVSKIGVITFLSGVILTELLLFGQGFLILAQLKSISNYNLLLFVCSCILLLGILLVFIAQILKPKTVL